MRNNLQFCSGVSRALGKASGPLKHNAGEKTWRRHFWVVIFSIFVALGVSPQVQGANRSAYIPYDESWISPPDFKWIAFDQVHQQIFTAWLSLDRIDVLSAVDYHVIRSITVPSPSSLDISPDGTTLAVGTSSAHILFFDTATFAKTNDVVFPESALGITAFVYTANGNAIIRAQEGLSTGGGITAYWNHVTNAFVNVSNAMAASGPYLTAGPLARSSDYSTILLGDASTRGVVQIINGNTGQIEQQLSYFGSYIDGVVANNNASRYALCVEPAGIAPLLLILDSSLNELYQDEAGCLGMTLSADGNSVYRDVVVNGSLYTQSLNMTTFSTTNVTTYFSATSSWNTLWEAADSTGMVYGLNPNIASTVVFVAVDTTASSTPAIPALNDPVQIIRVIDNVGSPQGGDLIRLLCTGVDTVNASSVSVTLGGETATNLALAQLSSLSQPFSYLANLRLVEVKTPAGTPGLADVTLNVNGTSYTAAKAFQYAQSSKVFPFSTSPNFLLYDDFRQKLYASHANQVEVIDPIAQQVLTPLVPASGKLQNSQFAGLSLSPDGNRLYIADTGANLIHMLDLSNPGTGADVNPATALGSSSPISPGRVFETASGKLVGSDVNGNTFVIDGLMGGGTSLTSGLAWSSSNRGEHIFMSTQSCGAGMSNGLISNCLGLWNDAASEFQTSADFAQSLVEAAANEDGTAIIAGGSSSGAIDAFPEIVDFGLNTAGYIRNHFDTLMPIATPSFFLHPSGALLYHAGEVLLTEGITPFGDLVEIDDLHQMQPWGTVVFPEAFITSYSSYTNHMMTTDQTGRYLFGVTKSGITMMVLNTVPLSVGNLQPAFGQTAGGETVTLRGSGFLAGAVTSFGGVRATTTYVDANTLTATVPPLSAGWQDVTVTNSNGISYTAPGMFQVVAAQPTPKITGFSPAALAVESDIPGFDTPLTVTVQGSGFAAYDTVEINGQPTTSSFLDASDLQATIPAALTGVTGSIPITVVSPYTGSSNTASLPMVNPVPVIDYSSPPFLVTQSGSPGAGLNVSGTDFVAASVVQWNGQNLSTYLVGGENAGTGDEEVIGTVPASLLTGTGTATITVFNPSPGGGISNAVTLNIATNYPQVSFPASIVFGRVLLNAPATQSVQLKNFGTADYKLASVSAGSGPFSAQASACGDVPPQSSCNLQVQFLPTAAGAATGRLTITDNSLASPHIIPLTGTGTQSLAPSVILTSINSLMQTVTATVNGTATIGGSTVPATAWIEYGTSQTLATYTQTATWSFTGDGNLSGSLSGLNPATTYAARLAVQTAAGTGKSGIQLFATMPAPASVALALATGASNVATVTPGQAASYQLVASDGGNGYTGTATLSCTPVPSGPTCTISPSTVNVGVTPTPFTVTVATIGPSSTLLSPFSGGPVWTLGLLLAIAPMLSRKKRYRLALLICLTALTMFVFSCGGSGPASSTPTPTPTPPTPAGTYYMQINATSEGAQGSYLLTLVVK